MQKNIITNKITPCCNLPFSEMYWWVTNLTLNNESERQFIISKMSQSGTISVDAWKVLLNAGTLEDDAVLTKDGFLAWFNCERQPSCEQLKLIIEGYKVSNFDPSAEYGVGWTEISNFETYGSKVIRKVENYVGGVGDMPSELEGNIGKYYAAAGGFTTDKDLATDFKPSGSFLTSPVFDETDNTKPAGMKATAEWIGAIDTTTPLVLGMTNVGGSDAAMGGTGAENNLISNLNCKATRTLKVKSVVTNFSVGGTFKVAITDKNNVVIYTSPIYTAASGSQTTVLPDLTLNKDELIWLSCLDASTAKIRYGGASSNNNTRFIQIPVTTGVIVNGPVSSFYSIYFNTEFTENTGILKDYIPRSEAEGYTDVDPIETFGTATYTNIIGNQPATAYYILKIPFTTVKVVKELNFSGNGGNMTFVIGTLDQANKFIVDREFTVATTAGANVINVDQELKVGQYIGVRTPGSMPNIHTTLQNNYTWGVEGSLTNPLAPLTAWSLSLAIKVKTRQLNPNALVRQSQLTELEGKIENIQLSNVWKSPDGTNWKVGVSNTGQFTASAVGRYTKILHFGNSILKHAIVSYWWGLWGMAAKTRNDDYAHRFLTKIKVANPTAQSWEENIAAWEANPTGYNKANLDAILTAQTYDLVVVRLGENATATAPETYKTAFRDLIQYIQTKVPTARIIIGGMFWSNAGLDGAMQQIAIEKNLTFVDMSGLDTSANKSFIGDIVQGDDGQSHSVDNAGVANHPNNSGMEAIASRLFTAANS